MRQALPVPQRVMAVVLSVLFVFCPFAAHAAGESDTAADPVLLPIIMYHEVKPNKSGKDAIQPWEFEADLKWLADNGYTCLLYTSLCPPEQIKAVFELRLMCLAGYEPDLSCCAQCGAAEPDEPWFSPRGGAVYCAHCRGASSSAVTPLLPETLAAMRHSGNADPKKIFSFTLGDAGRRQLAHVCEDYTATQLERGFASLDYWKKVKD